MYVHISICVCMSIHMCIYAIICICLCICIVSIHTCICICIYTYIHMHTNGAYEVSEFPTCSPILPRPRLNKLICLRSGFFNIFLGRFLSASLTQGASVVRNRHACRIRIYLAENKWDIEVALIPQGLPGGACVWPGLILRLTHGGRRGFARFLIRIWGNPICPCASTHLVPHLAQHRTSSTIFIYIYVYI